MAFDITLAILFVGFSGILAYLATTTDTESKHSGIILVNSAMKLLFFAGSLGFILIGTNYGTLIAADACAPSDITDVPVTAYKVSIWIFVFVLFCVLLTIILNLLAALQLKKKKEDTHL